MNKKKKKKGPSREAKEVSEDKLKQATGGLSPDISAAIAGITTEELAGTLNASQIRFNDWAKAVVMNMVAFD